MEEKQTNDSILAEEIIAHHLRIFGYDYNKSITQLNGKKIKIFCYPESNEAELSEYSPANGDIIVAIQPDMEFCKMFSTISNLITYPVPENLEYLNEYNQPWSILRTLGNYQSYSKLNSSGSEPVVISGNDEAIWLWNPIGEGGILFIGNDLSRDLIRYRQGDPLQPELNNNKELWGYGGERPVYLFEAQLAGQDKYQRHADWWIVVLIETLRKYALLSPVSILPGGAPGAVIFSGDDDQASLENYSKQQKTIGSTPITYFLHPKTKHNRDSLDILCENKRISIGIHPDALDDPGNYQKIFDEQMLWFYKTTGYWARTVRNHGYLNDGYWGHIESWLKNGVHASANIPGLDGTVLNGSLLPARVVKENNLTTHWSILTLFGDGMLYALGMSGEQAKTRIIDAADYIKNTGVPGIIMVNMHPDNIADTGELHEVLLEIIQSGFIAWNLDECIDWFMSREPYYENNKIN